MNKTSQFILCPDNIASLGVKIIVSLPLQNTIGGGHKLTDVFSEGVEQTPVAPPRKRSQSKIDFSLMTSECAATEQHKSEHVKLWPISLTFFVYTVQHFMKCVPKSTYYIKMH